MGLVIGVMPGYPFKHKGQIIGILPLYAKDKAPRKMGLVDHFKFCSSGTIVPGKLGIFLCLIKWMILKRQLVWGSSLSKDVQQF